MDLSSVYPTGNFFPTSAAWQAGFVDYAGGDYHLLPTSLYKNAATDGTDLGADVDAILAQMANALSGDNSLPPGTSRIQILTTTLPNGTVGQWYSSLLACSGGSGPCGWQITSGVLPSGLAFDSLAATISGTATSPDIQAIAVQAYDPVWPSNNATASLSLTIEPPPFVVTIPPAPQGQVGEQYQHAASVSGAMGSPTWSVALGALPPGVLVDSATGLITGVPAGWGTYTAVVQAQDSWGTGRVDAKTLVATIAPTPLSIASSTLPIATYQASYGAAPAASGGTGATAWSLAAGVLPPGIALDAGGQIYGSPATVGTFAFTLQADDVNWPGNRAIQTVSPSAPRSCKRRWRLCWRTAYVVNDS